MDFSTLTMIVSFCLGAIFTLVDIGTDALLVKEYYSGIYVDNHREAKWNETSNGLAGEDNIRFASLSLIWMALGGFGQACVVLYLLFRGDERLHVLPKPLRILLLPTSLILMGPAVINIFATFYVIRHVGQLQLREKTERYVCVCVLLCMCVCMCVFVN